MCEFGNFARRFDADPKRPCQRMHFVAHDFSVEKPIARSETAERAHRANCRTTVSVAEPNVDRRSGRSATAPKPIVARSPQNRAHFFAPESKMRCRSHA